MKQEPKTILVTGGAGYIGSHFLETLSKAATQELKNFQVVILDDLSSGHPEILEVLQRRFVLQNLPEPVFEKVDLRNLAALKKIFSLHQPVAVLHFAGKISVAESVMKPELYHEVNVDGSRNLLQTMRENGCKNLVFSSTAAVYGNEAGSGAIQENSPLHPVNPYGKTKLSFEEQIRQAEKEWGLQAIIFRYFNAAGASLSGEIGEWHEPETHLIPLVLESVLKPGSELKVYGTDYPTRDGTCVRDYIHVVDLAEAHLLGLLRLLKNEMKGTEIFNLGTEQGSTVLEVIRAAQKVTGRNVKLIETTRRPGDAAVLIASSEKAKKVLGWKCHHSDIETILRTAFEWHRNFELLKSRLRQ